MRCDCCNKRLTDYEATLKHAELGVFMNTCVKCLKGLNIPVSGRTDLAEQLMVADESDEDLYDTDTEDYYKDVMKLMYDNPMEDI